MCREHRGPIIYGCPRPVTVPAERPAPSRRAWPRAWRTVTPRGVLSLRAAVPLSLLQPARSSPSLGPARTGQRVAVAPVWRWHPRRGPDPAQPTRLWAQLSLATSCCHRRGGAEGDARSRGALAAGSGGGFLCLENWEAAPLLCPGVEEQRGPLLRRERARGAASVPNFKFGGRGSRVSNSPTVVFTLRCPSVTAVTVKYF